MEGGGDGVPPERQSSLHHEGEGRKGMMDKTQRKIVTSPTHSSLPDRGHDFCAHYDGEEEAGGYGYGATPEAAIADFIANCHEACNGGAIAVSEHLETPRMSPGMQEAIDRLYELSGSQVSKPDFMAK